MKKNKQIAKSHSTTGEVRIIAGQWRGRKLPVLMAEGLRPTGDRVKETLFNWLMPYIVDAVCLDCFAGSGSLGFEALSRQAKSVTFLEQNKQIVGQLKRNLQTLKTPLSQAEVIHCNSLSWLKQSPNQPHFDLIFLDPPFHLGLSQQAIGLIAQANWVKPDGLIYIESEKDLLLNIPANWRLLKEKTTGMVSYRLFQYVVG